MGHYLLSIPDCLCGLTPLQIAHTARESLKPQSIKQVIFGVAKRGSVRICSVFLVTTAKAKCKTDQGKGTREV